MKVIGTPRHDALVAFLRAKRRGNGLTQAEVAARLGETQQWVALIESGQRRISVNELIALAEAIGFDPVQAVRTVAKIKP